MCYVLVVGVLVAIYIHNFVQYITFFEHFEAAGIPIQRLIPTSILGNSSESNWNICVVTTRHKGANILPQWITYHSIVGIDQFFVINSCTDDYDKSTFWLRFYDHLGLVTELDDKKCAHLHEKNYRDRHRNLFKKAKSSCQWILSLRLDEYIFPSDGEDFPPGKDLKISTNKSPQFLKSFLYNSTEDVYRLPIYVMSSKKPDANADGLLVDNYLYGEFNRKVGIIGRAHDIIQLDRSGHNHEYTSEFKANSGAYFDASNTEVKSVELTALNAEKSTCLLPETPMYIRQYVDVSLSRNSSVESKSMFRRRRCPLISESFRKKMSRRILDETFNQFSKYCNTTLTIQQCQGLFPMWLDGDILNCPK